MITGGSLTTVSTESVEATRALGRRLAGLLRPGDILLCSGELGAGKTVLAQGLGEGLGVEDAVMSPTFVLVRTHEGRLRFYHADLWRLEDAGEILDLSLAELVEDAAGAVAFVEWGERAVPVVGPDFLFIEVLVALPGERRLWTFQPSGPSWAERVEALAGVLAAEGE
jgi:tRNA threonylcarbamoyladenosine biosynthesis protein TsaE